MAGSSIVTTRCIAISSLFSYMSASRSEDEASEPLSAPIFNSEETIEGNTPDLLIGTVKSVPSRNAALMRSISALALELPITSRVKASAAGRPSPAVSSTPSVRQKRTASAIRINVPINGTRSRKRCQAACTG